jgi:hypothetical protein
MIKTIDFINSEVEIIDSSIPHQHPFFIFVYNLML